VQVVSLVGARPQFVKLAPVARALSSRGIDHKIIHTGQHYDRGMSDAFFEDLAIPPADVQLGVGSGSHGGQTGAILTKLDPVLTAMNPDWLLVYGDTNSTLAGAITAVKLHVPLAHLEAGLRSGNRRMPEEHNRVLTDHAADLCLAPTELAMRNLSLEALGDRSRLVGDVMTDICFSVRDRVRELPVPVPGFPPDEEYYLATIHRAENTDDAEHLAQLLERLSSLDLPVILAVHPRLERRSRELGLALDRGVLHPVGPLSYPAMISAVQSSNGVVTDSGGLQKEAFLLGKPCTTLRTETEWPETLEDGWNVLDPRAEHLAALVRRPLPTSPRKTPYGDGRAAFRVADELLR
jgi:UDP-N-acetylglucosamine 2-epimerase (non-hydrolysing)